MNFGYTPDDDPTVSPGGTALARHLAGIVDSIIAAILAVIAAKQIDEQSPYIQISVAVSAYLAYFFLFEIAISRTPGKLLTGLKIIDFEGKRCNVRQTIIRTLFRLLEVNPFLLGFLPAAIRILFSRNKQRFGDWVAGTIVVFARKI